MRKLSLFCSPSALGDISNLHSSGPQRLATHQLASQPVVTVTKQPESVTLPSHAALVHER